jgi:hypothetical protein
MARISSRDLKPGMKLIRAVENQNGLVMIGENTELTASLIEKIQGMDIASAYVQSEAKNLPPKEEQLAGVINRFKKVENEPYMTLVKTAVQEHIESLYEEHGSQDPEK